MQLDELYQLYLKTPKVSTDTRKIEAGSLFFALKGANFNGNAFAQEALQKGAEYAIIDEPAYQTNERCILVKDVLKALQQLAQLHRKNLNIPVIAIGGSNGKTTTKELVASVLAKKYTTFATQGNLNNHIGVPLTILSIPQNTEIAVIELGANHIGETAFLCQIAQPNFGVITNIGLDHLEGFGSKEGVMKANGELYKYLQKHKGIIFLNTNEKELVELAQTYKLTKKRIFTYPNEKDYLHCKLAQTDFFVAYETEQGNFVQTQLIGKYNFANIATALCIGKYFGVPAEKMDEAILSYVPRNNRSQILHQNTNIIILDAYNANPSSMKEAIENFAQMQTSQPKGVILGQMNELGSFSYTEHQNLGKLLAEKNFDLVVLYGNEMQPALQFLPKAYFFNDKFSLHNWLKDRNLQDWLLLIKGSRGTQMESVLEVL
ncbi:MAG: UDP-N-acetylmuramoyl-tripeptide--D-alanyl-D-alanine ligase [Raineya sp.]|nr:UDP-N-acetylmuramoyl-tripeptide--D-alanyl-D-alanine ligase [Raineya sp.]MDW8296657.1 UDP-N-acetylmuramoyl-tripeptide--D-alanyl-D-alanine ligase [Raineya sp.]